MTVLVRLIVCVGMLVVVPVGLALVAAPGLERLRRAWPLLAVPGVVALWLPRGWVAAGLGAVYAAATLALALTAAGRFAAAPVGAGPFAGGPVGGAPAARWRWAGRLVPREVAVLTALVTPSIAGLALVAERGGWHLFGYRLTTLALTEAHFHYAGFAAALLAGLTARAAPDSRAAAVAAVSVPLGTGIVLAGFFFGDGVGLAGAAVLTGGMWSAGWVSLREIRPAATDRLTRLLLGISAAVLAVTMVLALLWAFGGVFGTPRLSLAWMAATHGLANSLGFAVCGVFAWRRLRVPAI